MEHVKSNVIQLTLMALLNFGCLFLTDVPFINAINILAGMFCFGSAVYCYDGNKKIAQYNRHR